MASLTFTTDATGATPICTTAITSQTPVNTPLCTTATLPSLTAGGSSAYIFANVINDNQVLGVSWTVTCGSATSVGSGTINTACGAFSPAETTSGPVPLYSSTGIVSAFNPPSAVPKGGVVVLTAHATSLPSVSSSVSLTIAAAQTTADRTISAKRDLQVASQVSAAGSAAGLVSGNTRASGQ